MRSERLKSILMMLKGETEHCPTASYYHNGTVNHEKRKVKKRYYLDQNKASESKSEGFNAFILAVNKNTSYEKE